MCDDKKINFNYQSKCKSNDNIKYEYIYKNIKKSITTKQ